MADASQPKKVVIVGGGMGGSMAAKLLENVADVTLIDSKEYMEILWATLRALVEPAVAEKVFIPHSAYLKKAKVVVGVATSVTDKEVKVGDTAYPYDYLVLATGRVPPPPMSRAEKIAQVKAESAKLKEAKTVLIVGGGPTGVELAGEIVTDFPDKKVTLVHGGSRLLEFVPEKAGAKALKWLQSKGVTVKFNQKLEITPDQWGSSGTFKTVSGEDIATDYLAVAVGARANAAWLEEAFPGLVEKNGLKVEPEMRVSGHSNVFAIGDVANLTPKQGYLAIVQAQLAVANIKTLIDGEAKGKPAKALKKYSTPPSMAMISLGRKNGVAFLPFGTFTGWFPTTVKSKDLFISKVHKDLSVTA